MINDAVRKPRLSVAKRKENLLAQGAMYRSGISQSKQVVRANLRPESLAKNALGYLATHSTALIGQVFSLQNLKNGNLQLLIPLLTTGISLLSKKSLIRPIARGALVAGVIGTVAFFVFKKKARRIRADKRY